jgi:hypothetical protein
MSAPPGKFTELEERLAKPRGRRTHPRFAELLDEGNSWAQPA